MAEENEWNKMRRAKEEAFFDKQNKAALERLRHRKSEEPRLSPVTGEPMEQITLMGVVIDRCPKSGGVWLDAGELEQILAAGKDRDELGGTKWLRTFFGALAGK